MAEETKDQLLRRLATEGIEASQDMRRRLDADEDIWLDIMSDLLPAYMKPPSATVTDPVTMKADAERDAQFLCIAADAVLAEFRARYPKEP